MQQTQDTPSQSASSCFCSSKEKIVAEFEKLMFLKQNKQEEFLPTNQKYLMLPSLSEIFSVISPCRQSCVAQPIQLHLEVHGKCTLILTFI